MIDPDDATVSFTVKELLKDIRNEQTKGFAEVKAALEQKATKADVARLQAGLDGHAKELSDHRREIGALKQLWHDKEVAADVHVERDERTWTTRRKVVAFLGSVGVIVATVLGPYIGTHL